MGTCCRWATAAGTRPIRPPIHTVDTRPWGAMRAAGAPLLVRHTPHYRSGVCSQSLGRHGGAEGLGIVASGFGQSQEGVHAGDVDAVSDAGGEDVGAGPPGALVDGVMLLISWRMCTRGWWGWTRLSPNSVGRFEGKGGRPVSGEWRAGGVLGNGYCVPGIPRTRAQSARDVQCPLAGRCR